MRSQTINKKASKQKQTPPENDRIAIRYIPLPPAKRAAWNYSMKLLTSMLIEILNEEKKELLEEEIIESQF